MTRASLKTLDANAKRDPPPTTPGTKMRKLETENEELRDNIHDLVKVLGKIDFVKTSDSASVAPSEKKEKKKKCTVVPAKTAYKFYCDTLPAKQKESANLQQLWKETAPEIREPYVKLAQADKARYQSEMEAYNKETMALEMYYDKKKQEQAMAFYEAHLEAQALLEKTQDDGTVKGKGKGKAKKEKDPDAPKRAMSSYMYFAQDMRTKVAEENPDAKVTEISKILGEMWGKLDKTKSGKNGAKKYEDMAAEDRDRYNKEKEVYDVKVADRKQAEQEACAARLVQDKKEALELLESQSVQVPHIGGDLTGMDTVSVISDLSASKAPATKKKKDPNAPKRALTAYNYFVSENRESIKAKMPASSTNAEVFAEVGKQWKVLTDRKKQKYNKMAAKDQERYAKEMKTYTPSN
ncbi:group protein B3 [Seminavis robusta]|uniref:Group protein B3 n=1 Tax=Seminavis robusta TaxID=568900 RepID=A0A9N8HC28_9STRA|nr:group protein B3 [Seminavis robusta]|eukprot:Sro302_g112170.1 group protein B3 (409) ;mRNA; r:20043-21269